MFINDQYNFICDDDFALAGAKHTWNIMKTFRHGWDLNTSMDLVSLWRMM